MNNKITEEYIVDRIIDFMLKKENGKNVEK